MVTAPTGASQSSLRPREGEWWRLRQRVLDRWIRAGLPGDLHAFVLKTDLFDEASGPHHHLQQAGLQAPILGIDWDRRIAGAARDRLVREGEQVRLAVCDVRALPFATGCLGAVLSLSTLDHFEGIDSIVDSLQELMRVLVPGGRLLLTLDNPWNPEVRLRTGLPSGLVSRLRADRFAWGKLLNTWQAERVFRRLGITVKRRGYLIHAPRYVGIRMLNWLERRRWNAWTRRVVRLIEAFELLSRSPLRAFTGHYIAWWLEKP